MDMTQPRVLTREILGTSMIKITVGEAKREFTFHRDLACGLSRVIEFLCRGMDGDIDLPHEESEDIEAFEYLVDYLYRGVVPTGPEKKDPEYATLIRQIYYLADGYYMSDLANKAMDAFQNYQLRTHTRLSCRAMLEVYASTVRNDSPMRWYCAVTAAVYVLRDWRDRHSAPDMDRWLNISEEHPNFLVDMTRAQGAHRKNILEHRADHRERKDEHGFHHCEFHLHYPGEKCHLTGLTTPIEELSEDEGDVAEEDANIDGDDIQGVSNNEDGETEEDLAIEQDNADSSDEKEKTREKTDEESEESEDSSEDEGDSDDGQGGEGRVAQDTGIQGSDSSSSTETAEGAAEAAKVAEEKIAEAEEEDEDLERQIRGVSLHDQQDDLGHSQARSLQPHRSLRPSAVSPQVADQTLPQSILPAGQHAARTPLNQATSNRVDNRMDEESSVTHSGSSHSRKRGRMSTLFGSFTPRPNPFYDEFFETEHVKRPKTSRSHQPQRISSPHIKEEEENQLDVGNGYPRQSGPPTGPRIKEEPQGDAQVKQVYVPPLPYVEHHVKREEQGGGNMFHFNAQPAQPAAGVSTTHGWVPGKFPRTHKERVARREYNDHYGLCRVCNSPAHGAMDCPKSFRNDPNYICPFCGSKGHPSWVCERAFRRNRS